jgi:hypothetical protein
LDRFVDVNKMIRASVTGHLAGGFCLGYDGGKVAPFIVTKQVLEVTGEPILDAALGLLGVGFEGRGEGLDDLRFHAARLIRPHSSLTTAAWEAGFAKGGKFLFRLS